MTVEELIEEMKECKLANPTLEISDVLRIFQIDALAQLINVIVRKS